MDGDSRHRAKVAGGRHTTRDPSGIRGARRAPGLLRPGWRGNAPLAGGKRSTRPAGLLVCPAIVVRLVARSGEVIHRSLEAGSIAVRALAAEGAVRSGR